VSYANAFVPRVDIGQGQQGLRDLRRALSLPTLRTGAVWKERTGAETKALLAMKDLESMMIDVLCFLAKLSVNTSQWRSWRRRRTWSWVAWREGWCGDWIGSRVSCKCDGEEGRKQKGESNKRVPHDTVPRLADRTCRPVLLQSGKSTTSQGVASNCQSRDYELHPLADHIVFFPARVLGRTFHESNNFMLYNESAVFTLFRLLVLTETRPATPPCSSLPAKLLSRST